MDRVLKLITTFQLLILDEKPKRREAFKNTIQTESKFIDLNIITVLCLDGTTVLSMMLSTVGYKYSLNTAQFQQEFLITIKQLGHWGEGNHMIGNGCCLTLMGPWNTFPILPFQVYPSVKRL